jgi:hypothetical protein
MEKKHLDKRVAERYVTKGLMKKEELEKHLKALPDSEAEGIWVQMDLHDTEVGDDTDDLDTEDGSEEA